MAGPDEPRRWDMTSEFVTDETHTLGLDPVDDFWFANQHPSATYVGRIPGLTDVVGVFEVTDDALLLRGSASPDPGPTATALSFDPPVAVLSFPLEANAQWDVVTDVTGVVDGVPVFYEEAYETRVDAFGELSTPYAEFEVLRVHTTMVRTVGLIDTTFRTNLFVTPCFGVVGWTVSREDEPSPEYSNVAEILRLTP